MKRICLFLYHFYYSTVFVLKAYHEIKDNNDVKKALELLKECELLKIEDLLPFFSDFERIDDFKEPICESLKVRIRIHCLPLYLFFEFFCRNIIKKFKSYNMKCKNVPNKLNAYEKICRIYGKAVFASMQMMCAIIVIQFYW